MSSPLSTIDLFFSGFTDYVSKYIVATNGHGELSVTFVYLSYDLIDKDLDFEEEYYDKFIDNMQTVLSQEILTILKNNDEFPNIPTHAVITGIKQVMQSVANVKYIVQLDTTSTSKKIFRV